VPLAPGVRLGIYEVRDLIGAGGMGEVYRGYDSKLNRSVALKILPEVFALDADRLSRFRREAQVLASLNHANIGSIFGFEESNGVHALVLELVDGPTLADCIARGPIPVEEALPMARQIAEALEAAHAQGIVHRDLKPANVKVRPDGTVKVLDFGLAKALTGDAASQSGSGSLTITSPATQFGIILGTAAYMSPEQARGKPIDKRSDVWALGGVLFEMLAGRRAFDGDDVSDTLANVLKREPDWSALPADTPASVRRVLRRCLEKDPRRRIHDIADVRLDLDESAEDIAPAPPLVPAKTGAPTRERAAWALLAAALAGGLGYVTLREAPAPQVVRFQIDPPERGSFGSSTGVGRMDGTTGGALSPDGTQLVFIAEQGGQTRLWLRRLDAFASRPLAGTEGALTPFWSPDGSAIGFFAGGKMQRLDLADGAIRTLCDVPVLTRGASWSSADLIVFTAGSPPQLSRVSARGGEVTPFAVAGADLRGWPSFLPDGRRFLFLGRFGSDDAASLMVGSIDPGSTATRVVTSDSNGAFVPPGLLVFARGASLLQQRFDPDRLTVTGEATPIVEEVFYNPGVGRADFSVSRNGVLAFRSASNRSNQFAWFDRAGRQLETIGAPGNYRTHDLSLDGTRLVYADNNLGDIWIVDLVRQTSSRFTAEPGTETAPVWFPDGTKIAYRSSQGGLFEKGVSGTATAVQVLKGQVNGPVQVSRDGKWILYFMLTPGRSLDIYVLPTSGDREPKAIVQSPFPEVEPQVSPDMRWLAYASTETGRNEVYVQPFPPTGQRWQVSSSGGRQPQWRADGRELYFVGDDRRFHAVDIADNANSFEYGVPKFLFEMRANTFNSRNSYVPSHDGQRFLVNALLGADDAPISVVQNWQTGVGK
jgi:Tol biopolymer transport system component